MQVSVTSDGLFGRGRDNLRNIVERANTGKNRPVGAGGNKKFILILMLGTYAPEA